MMSDPSPRPENRIGVDVPDSRGRTALDQAGRGLSGNPGIIVSDVEVVSDG